MSDLKSPRTRMVIGGSKRTKAKPIVTPSTKQSRKDGNSEGSTNETDNVDAPNPSPSTKKGLFGIRSRVNKNKGGNQHIGELANKDELQAQTKILPVDTSDIVQNSGEMLSANNGATTSGGGIVGQDWKRVESGNNKNKANKSEKISSFATKNGPASPSAVTNNSNNNNNNNNNTGFAKKLHLSTSSLQRSFGNLASPTLRQNSFRQASWAIFGGSFRNLMEPQLLEHDDDDGASACSDPLSMSSSSPFKDPRAKDDDDDDKPKPASPQIDRLFSRASFGSSTTTTQALSVREAAAQFTGDLQWIPILRQTETAPSALASDNISVSSDQSDIRGTRAHRRRERKKKEPTKEELVAAEMAAQLEALHELTSTVETMESKLPVHVPESEPQDPAMTKLQKESSEWHNATGSDERVHKQRLKERDTIESEPVKKKREKRKTRSSTRNRSHSPPMAPEPASVEAEVDLTDSIPSLANFSAQTDLSSMATDLFSKQYVVATATDTKEHIKEDPRSSKQPKRKKKTKAATLPSSDAAEDESLVDEVDLSTFENLATAEPEWHAVRQPTKVIRSPVTPYDDEPEEASRKSKSPRKRDVSAGNPKLGKTLTSGRFDTLTASLHSGDTSLGGSSLMMDLVDEPVPYIPTAAIRREQPVAEDEHSSSDSQGNPKFPRRQRNQKIDASLALDVPLESQQGLPESENYEPPGAGQIPVAAMNLISSVRMKPYNDVEIDQALPARAPETIQGARSPKKKKKKKKRGDRSKGSRSNSPIKLDEELKVVELRIENEWHSTWSRTPTEDKSNYSEMAPSSRKSKQHKSKDSKKMKPLELQSEDDIVAASIPMDNEQSWHRVPVRPSNSDEKYKSSQRRKPQAETTHSAATRNKKHGLEPKDSNGEEQSYEEFETENEWHSNWSRVPIVAKDSTTEADTPLRKPKSLKSRYEKIAEPENIRMENSESERGIAEETSPIESERRWHRVPLNHQDSAGKYELPQCEQREAVATVDPTKSAMHHGEEPKEILLQKSLQNAEVALEAELETQTEWHSNWPAVPIKTECAHEDTEIPVIKSNTDQSKSSKMTQRLELQSENEIRKASIPMESEQRWHSVTMRPRGADAETNDLDAYHETESIEDPTPRAKNRKQKRLSPDSTKSSPTRARGTTRGIKERRRSGFGDDSAGKPAPDCYTDNVDDGCVEEHKAVNLNDTQPYPSASPVKASNDARILHGQEAPTVPQAGPDSELHSSDEVRIGNILQSPIQSGTDGDGHLVERSHPEGEKPVANGTPRDDNSCQTSTYDQLLPARARRTSELHAASMKPLTVQSENPSVDKDGDDSHKMAEGQIGVKNDHENVDVLEPQSEKRGIAIPVRQTSASSFDSPFPSDSERDIAAPDTPVYSWRWERTLRVTQEADVESAAQLSVSGEGNVEGENGNHNKPKGTEIKSSRSMQYDSDSDDSSYLDPQRLGLGNESQGPLDPNSSEITAPKKDGVKNFFGEERSDPEAKNFFGEKAECLAAENRHSRNEESGIPPRPPTSVDAGMEMTSRQGVVRRRLSLTSPLHQIPASPSDDLTIQSVDRGLNISSRSKELRLQVNKNRETLTSMFEANRSKSRDYENELLDLKRKLALSQALVQDLEVENDLIRRRCTLELAKVQTVLLERLHKRETELENQFKDAMKQRNAAIEENHELRMIISGSCPVCRERLPEKEFVMDFRVRNTVLERRPPRSSFAWFTGSLLSEAQVSMEESAETMGAGKAGKYKHHSTLGNNPNDIFETGSLATTLPDTGSVLTSNVQMFAEAPFHWLSEKLFHSNDGQNEKEPVDAPPIVEEIITYKRIPNKSIGSTTATDGTNREAMDEKNKKKDTPLERSRLAKTEPPARQFRHADEYKVPLPDTSHEFKGRSRRTAKKKEGEASSQPRQTSKQNKGGKHSTEKEKGLENVSLSSEDDNSKKKTWQRRLPVTPPPDKPPSRRVDNPNKVKDPCPFPTNDKPALSSSKRPGADKSNQDCANDDSRRKTGRKKPVKPPDAPVAPGGKKKTSFFGSLVGEQVLDDFSSFAFQTPAPRRNNAKKPPKKFSLFSSLMAEQVEEDMPFLPGKSAPNEPPTTEEDACEAKQSPADRSRALLREEIVEDDMLMLNEFPVASNLGSPDMTVQGVTVASRSLSLGLKDEQVEDDFPINATSVNATKPRDRAGERSGLGLEEEQVEDDFPVDPTNDKSSMFLENAEQRTGFPKKITFLGWSRDRLNREQVQDDMGSLKVAQILAQTKSNEANSPVAKRSSGLDDVDYARSEISPTKRNLSPRMEPNFGSPFGKKGTVSSRRKRSGTNRGRRGSTREGGVPNYLANFRSSVVSDSLVPRETAESLPETHNSALNEGLGDSHSSSDGELSPLGKRASAIGFGSLDSDLLGSRPWRSDAGKLRKLTSKLTTQREADSESAFDNLDSDEESTGPRDPVGASEALRDDLLAELDSHELQDAKRSQELLGDDPLSALDAIPSYRESENKLTALDVDPLSYLDALAGENSYSPEGSTDDLLGDISPLPL